MSAEEPKSMQFPEPSIRGPSRLRVSVVWLVPLVAALVGLGLLLRAYVQAGPEITISFKNAEGLEAGKTEVKYKDVAIGRVREIELSSDHTQVLVRVELKKTNADLAVRDTRFWVVRPRADLGGVSGLGTLLSGAYIGMDVGRLKETTREFEGLELPPRVTNDQQGGRYLLRADNLGSLNIGSPVYYRRIPVGSVVGFDLEDRGQGVVVEVFVEAPYNHFVTQDTRFWNASGVDLSVDASGVKVNTQSLLTLVAGGVAFQSGGQREAPVVEDNTSFRLYDDERTALAPPDGRPLWIVMRFYQSTRGLSTGAPIDFQGTEIGTVKDIHLEYDADKKRFATEVAAEVFPQRLGVALDTLVQSDGDAEASARVPLMRLIDRGLRAQLRLGSIITGQLYVALDFLPRVPASFTAQGDSRLEIPTAPASLEEIQTQIADIARKLNEIPFGEIGREAVETLQSAQALIADLKTEVAPEARQTLEELQKTLDAANRTLTQNDAPLQIQTRKSLEEMERAARSMRTLSDYLQRHPEALIRGKPDTPDVDAVYPQDQQRKP